jgi:hypothetical protein
VERVFRLIWDARLYGHALLVTDGKPTVWKMPNAAGPLPPDLDGDIMGSWDDVRRPLYPIMEAVRRVLPVSEERSPRTRWRS